MTGTQIPVMIHWPSDMRGVLVSGPRTIADVAAVMPTMARPMAPKSVGAPRDDLQNPICNVRLAEARFSGAITSRGAVRRPILPDRLP